MMGEPVCGGDRLFYEFCLEDRVPADRWFCRLGLEDKVPDHSSFSVNRHGRFRESDILRKVFEGASARREARSAAA